MTENKGHKLNVDLSQLGLEKHIRELKRRITDKITDGYGYELKDDSLSTWIVVIAVYNNKTKEEVNQELVEFINENADDFSHWLWNEVPKVLATNQEIKTETENKEQKAVNDKPKLKSAVFVKRIPTEKDLKDNRQRIWNNSINLMRKAIKDTQK